MVETGSGSEGASAPGGEGDGVPERRGAPRYPAGGIGFRSRQIQAYLVDLGEGGLAIESLEQPPIGSILSFALERGRARVDTEAEVRWCSLKRTYRTAEGDIVAVYRAGLRLGEERPRLLDSMTRAARREATGGHA